MNCFHCKAPIIGFRNMVYGTVDGQRVPFHQELERDCKRDHEREHEHQSNDTYTRNLLT